MRCFSGLCLLTLLAPDTWTWWLLTLTSLLVLYIHLCVQTRYPDHHDAASASDHSPQFLSGPGVTPVATAQRWAMHFLYLFVCRSVRPLFNPAHLLASVFRVLVVTDDDMEKVPSYDLTDLVRQAKELRLAHSTLLVQVGLNRVHSVVRCLFTSRLLNSIDTSIVKCMPVPLPC